MLIIHFFLLLLFCFYFYFHLCIYSFFDYSVSRKNVLSLFLQKIRRSVLYSCKLITFKSNLSINFPRETALDIVLDVSENSRGNVYSEVLSKITAYQHGSC